MRAGLPILLVLGFHYQQSHKLHQLSRPTVLSSKEHCSHSVLPSLIIVTSSRSWQNRKKFNQCSVWWTEWFTRKWCFNTTGALFHSLHWIVRYFIFKKIYIFLKKFCQVMWRFSRNSTHRGTVNKENETWFIVKALNKSLCLP